MKKEFQQKSDKPVTEAVMQILASPVTGPVETIRTGKGDVDDVAPLKGSALQHLQDSVIKKLVQNKIGSF